MTIQEFKQKTKKGGFDPHGLSSEAEMFLSPEAWRACGKVEGWEIKVCRKCGMDSEWKRLPKGKENWCDYCRTPSDNTHCQEWLYNMHSMIDALAEGKSIKEYIKTL